MSDAVGRRELGWRELGWRLWQQLPLLVALVALWMLLWGSLNLLNFVSGVVVAIGVTRFFYLPAVKLSGRFDVFWFTVFLARFFVSLVVASFQVAFQSIGPRGITSNAVAMVDLDTRSDFVMTLTAITVSLVPGSIVIEVDRENSILYLHVLGARSLDDVERARVEVLRVERSLVRALGSKEDMRRLR